MLRIFSQSNYWKNARADEFSSSKESLWRYHSDAVNGALLERWVPPAQWGGKGLKTDLFDEASGTGLCRTMSSLGISMVGLDISTSVHAEVHRRHPKLMTAAGDVRQLPFAAGSFDIIISISTLDHFASKTEIASALKELACALRPGGHLIVTLDNPLNPIVRLRNFLPKSWLLLAGIVPYYIGPTMSLRELEKNIRAVGLETLRHTAILHCPRLGAILAARILNNRSPELQKRFLRLLRAFERLEGWKSLYLTGYYVAVLAKKLSPA